MFERYTEESRRAIYFAAAAGVSAGTAYITSEHLLLGLLAVSNSRANAKFNLRNCLPDYVTVLNQMAQVCPLINQQQLTNDSKRILSYATMEAERLHNYWIDTEHLLLGILREESCTAALQLKQAGIDLSAARKVISESKSSGTEYGPVPFWWRLWSKIKPYF
jgi:ATP-dependent Clp protease ATP-binding subunit ClpC